MQPLTCSPCREAQTPAAARRWRTGAACGRSRRRGGPDSTVRDGNTALALTPCQSAPAAPSLQAGEAGRQAGRTGRESGRHVGHAGWKKPGRRPGCSAAAAARRRRTRRVAAVRIHDLKAAGHRPDLRAAAGRGAERRFGSRRMQAGWLAVLRHQTADAPHPPAGTRLRCSTPHIPCARHRKPARTAWHSPPRRSTPQHLPAALQRAPCPAARAGPGKAASPAAHLGPAAAPAHPTPPAGPPAGAPPAQCSPGPSRLPR